MKQNLNYPVEGYVRVKGYGLLPVLKVPMLDAARERELAARSAEHWKEERIHHG